MRSSRWILRVNAKFSWQYVYNLYWIYSTLYDGIAPFSSRIGSIHMEVELCVCVCNYVSPDQRTTHSHTHFWPLRSEHIAFINRLFRVYFERNRFTLWKYMAILNAIKSCTPIPNIKQNRAEQSSALSEFIKWIKLWSWFHMIFSGISPAVWWWWWWWWWFCQKDVSQPSWLFAVWPIQRIGEVTLMLCM